jgi:Coenzyme PQQ synthesis protein D (PqqD)
MKYKINRNIILQKLDEKLVGFDVERSFLYTFNETAEVIYKKIKLGWEVEKIAAYISRKYDAAVSVIEKDINVLIKDLIKNKIILGGPEKTKKSK